MLGPWVHTQQGSEGPSPSGSVLTGREIPASVAAPALGNYCPQCSQLQLHSLPFLSSEVPSPSWGWSNHPHPSLASGPETLGGEGPYSNPATARGMGCLCSHVAVCCVCVCLCVHTPHTHAHVPGCLAVIIPKCLFCVYLNVIISVCLCICLSVFVYIYVCLWVCICCMFLFACLCVTLVLSEPLGVSRCFCM